MIRWWIPWTAEQEYQPLDNIGLNSRRFGNSAPVLAARSTLLPRPWSVTTSAQARLASLEVNQAILASQDLVTKGMNFIQHPPSSINAISNDSSPSPRSLMDSRGLSLIFWQYNFHKLPRTPRTGIGDSPPLHPGAAIGTRTGNLSFSPSRLQQHSISSAAPVRRPSADNHCVRGSRKWCPSSGHQAWVFWPGSSHSGDLACPQSPSGSSHPGQ